ncbi:MAG: hypothetical protein A2504_14945 [Bdellovibrionales bacterium RIFOXYD12_FULL_39_22]|nr:MAG: hypothetical protein A2385_10410 [Bdellovibrionales bacterium RIFOXYB1_FULL_39_21]OFZ40872.1 MAG: hypothetical protein A2485_17570 [Bdellovibrionales bacterium RIFOXYC12_FULL_39_17]OFZ44413.1 MAG: hypothetical protein A2404_11180 [Bdellovibrionales bacterium RIFOXYC1_FULL_39_130]OFZ71878.1 MAG: hypothetical protein A2451_14075 [Bdellovibrionales bacterium RIFOXYC2_FULL_39_8]OFZ74160.1 MAG: hypothetical protein A2560_03845 [Bdellovibrionales bacterium RIFOXYD1_FULL_39_84]OFZ92009.1 MAG:
MFLGGYFREYWACSKIYFWRLFLQGVFSPVFFSFVPVFRGAARLVAFLPLFRNEVFGNQ